MFSSFNSVHSSIAKNVKQNVVAVISSIFSISSITYGGTTVSSYSGSITSGNMIISGIDASNSYNVYAFGASGQTYVINYSTNSSTTAYILAVGGGGGGGSYGGGGGGGGGVVMTPITLNPSVGTITINPGRGGAGYTGEINVDWTTRPNYTTTTPAGLNTDGSNTTINFAVISGSLPTISSTSISNITAYGGGRGAANNYFVGNSGGSGGGGGYVSVAAGSANTYSSNPYINYASNGAATQQTTLAGGAGGGAGAVSTNRAEGGYGKQTLNSLLGIANFTPTGYSNFGNYYWGGGGGGSQNSSSGNNASGGWGGGGGTTNNGTIGVGDNHGITNSTAGTGQNTLSGAGGQGTGGGGAGGNNINGGNGGSGIVVIAFPIAVPFTPNSISGLKLWFDASDISGNGTNVTNGTLINKWFDKSGLNNHATANANITYNSTGLNSKSTMTFDDVSKYLTGNNSISGPYLAMFVIASIRNNPPAVSVAIAFSSGLGQTPYDSQAFNEFTLNSTTGLIPFRNLVQPNPLPYLPPTSTPTLFEAWYDGSYMYSTAQSGSNTTLRTLPASTGNFSSTFFCIGSSTAPASNTFFTGSISEILVYNPSSALAYSDIQKIEGYLSWKWGLQTNLQTSHPYYNNPP